MKNYYQILNVKPTATEEEIKRSYRILAKRYHPDVNPGDSSAADKFADINEAHDTLSDAQKRAEYDNKLKEAAAPKLKPEDIIARQRAAAQAAARQAAMRNSAAARQNIMQQNAARQAAMRNSAAARAAAYRRDPTMSIAQQRAAAQAAAAAAQAAHIHAAQSQAQAQAQNMRAQMTAIKNQAYAQGYDRGVADTKATAEKEKAQLDANIKALDSEIQALNDKLTETERDRSDLEQELFNRDRELSKSKNYTLELEQQIEILRGKLAAIRPNKHSDADYESLHKLFEKAQAQIRTLETEKTQEELKNKAQLQLQTDKRKQIQEQANKLQKQVSELTRELEVLRTENNQWQDYAKSEQFLSDAEERLQEWDKKQKADKKLAKPTLYGLLGVLIWASEEEISQAYVKLGKRYAGKGDDAKEKLKKATDAYAILADPKKRAEYNNSIGITEERIEKERKLIAENAAIEEEYRKQLDNKEFWAKFDELSFNAQTGDAEAQNSLGELYYFGDEIEQDYEHAVFWFKEAAKQKHAEAMYNLGMCFINGEGVDKNKTTGLGFVRQAAKLGSKSAIQYVSKKQ